MIRHIQILIGKIGCSALLVLAICSTVYASQSKEAGSGYIPDVLVSFDSKKGTEYAIVVEMATQSLFVYAYDGALKEIYRLNSSTGEVPGAKSRSGDSKTPVGVYFFTTEHQKRDLAPIYGTRAFPMDYPNILDRIAGRDGNSIWLHGTNKPLKPRDSNGCIVLSNDDIDMVAKYITLNRTPIIVVEKLSYAPADSMGAIQKSIYRFLAHWKDALGTGTYHEYLSHYDPGYVPDISWWSDWMKVKKPLQASPLPVSIELKETSIFRFGGIDVVLFHQMVKFADKEIFTGTRKLFLTNRENQYQIVGEEYQTLPETMADKRQENPLVAAFRGLKTTPAPEKEEEPNIAKLIDEWLQAWASKDVLRYGDFYAASFRSQGMNLKQWLNYKEQLNKKYDYIRISKDNLVVQKGKNQSAVSFVQTYESSGFKAVGVKELVLIREKGRWKIYRETWKKK